VRILKITYSEEEVKIIVKGYALDMTQLIEESHIVEVSALTYDGITIIFKPKEGSEEEE